ncbi:MAG TPA: hypothetical protein VIK93_11460 [Limnochordales bacterium]
MTQQFIGRPGFGFVPDIPRPDPELVKALSAFPTTVIADALEGFVSMHPSVKPISDTMRVCGPAVTVKLPPGDNLMLNKAVDLAQPGDVLVVDAGGVLTNGCWGELMSWRAKTKGLGGLVLYGCVRDIGPLREVGWPVFAIGANPVKCSKEGPGVVNLPIACAGVVVHPGDIVVGDADGVVVVPQARAAAVAEQAARIQQKDDEELARIRAGQIIPKTIDEILRKKGILC